MYVSLYPQLVAGPIVRYSDIASELEQRTIDLEDLVEGGRRFAVGLCKKVLVANVAGELCSQYMGAAPDTLSVLGAWFGIVMYALQIYYDFSAYSDMAIGLGRMFGFHYLENFNYPYISRTATEFWRRWHISLGSFFRDYVYIPLGGNRRHQYVNLFVVWFLTGFWHGASWNFILWGIYWGVLIMLERLFLFKVLQRVPKVLARIYFLLIMLVGWVIFYFTDLGAMESYLRVLFGAAGQPLWDLAC
jgi:alginate O-acetyltransferase complex protein AlgI